VAEAWAPPTPAVIIPTSFPDEIEVQVFGQSGGTYLVGAVELVSPGNKDRPETRRAFAAKCSSYLQLGIGLVVVDVVTERRGGGPLALRGGGGGGGGPTLPQRRADAAARTGSDLHGGPPAQPAVGRRLTSPRWPADLPATTRTR
jgi:hypothetical protein